MTRSLAAHFDGKVIVPDEPVQLPVGQPLRIQVDTIRPSPTDREAALARLLRHAGAVDLGQPTGTDNLRIDQDLASEYASTHAGDQ